MTLLVIAPDYASHALPLIAAGRAWQRRGQRVVVATGPAMAPLVRSAGMEYTELIMSRGSNAGVIGTDHAQDEEARSLEAFFDASKRGMVATLRYQAEQRSTDLLWRPVQVARRTLRILDVHAPTAVLVDHLAFAATIGLRAAGVPYGDVVLGHPTALPVGGEVYGVPVRLAACHHSGPAGAGVAARRRARGHRGIQQRLQRRAPNGGAGFSPSTMRSGPTATLVLYNYPALLHGPARTARLPRHAFLGSLVRHEELDADIRTWLAQRD